MRRHGWIESLYHIIFILKPFLLLLLASSQMEYLVAQTNTPTTYSKDRRESVMAQKKVNLMVLII